MNPVSPLTEPTEETKGAACPVESSHQNQLGARSNAAELPRLPPELWTLIFRQLGPFCLSRVRLTCTTWRDIVSNSRALMDKFCIELVIDSNEGRSELQSLLTAGSGFRRATIEFLDTEIYSKFWEGWRVFGEGLTALTIFEYHISFFNVVELLRRTPNLKCLVYYEDDDYGSVCTNTYHVLMLEACTDFRLNVLEEVSIHSCCRNSSVEVLHFIGKLCPRVRTLNIVSDFGSYDISEHFSDTAVSIANQVRHSLRELQFIPTKNALKRLATIDDLKLDKLTLDAEHVCSFEIVQFLRSQPGIQHLYLLRNEIFQMADLLTMNKLLPKLRSLKMKHVVDFPPAMLRKLENLQLVYDAFEDSTVRGFDLPKLKRLQIVNCTWPNQALSDFFRHCPNIRSAQLDCWFENLIDILRTINQSNTLKELELKPLLKNATEPEEITFDLYGSTALRSLLVDNKLPENALIAMMKLYPNLTELYLEYRPAGEAVYRGICQHLKKLNVLVICGCLKRKKGRITESCRPGELLVICCDSATMAPLALCAAQEGRLPLRHVSCGFLAVDRGRSPVYY
ncbi:uncharacterized protein LOC6047710 [Culex quinquefasciatus]|uniref:uncharacterized protein LOC6047710 n=1 Tax=Culex quinquefasciatus TaxID=7176 RepID=UPI0018E29FF5|nr:uncharacterized protein LOC6047710 [Culex quinquefasciatus]